MAEIRLAADSTTLTLNGYTFKHFVAGEILTLTPVNPSTARTNGSQNTVGIQGRTDAKVFALAIKSYRLSEDDVYLNEALNSDVPVLFNGSMKETYTIDGVDSVESWILENGSITTQPTSTKNNQDGNFMAEYTIEFRVATRNI